MHTNFNVQLIKHSKNPVGCEALSWLVTYERMIHAEVMTHRWSRNYSSSRAIPYKTMMDWISADPANHLHLGSNKAGMQSGALCEGHEALREEIINKQKEMRVWTDSLVERYDPHKEVVNRYNEPWGWITGIMTMGKAQFLNYIAVRCTRFANPNIQRLAITMLRLYSKSNAQLLIGGEWHTPFFDDYVPYGSMGEIGTPLTWSTARAAWCSYNNPTKDATFEKAAIRHDDCITNLHVTPLEHQLQARMDKGRSGLVPGFNSYRSMIPSECATLGESDILALLEKYEGKDYIL